MNKTSSSSFFKTNLEFPRGTWVIRLYVQYIVRTRFQITDHFSERRVTLKWANCLIARKTHSLLVSWSYRDRKRKGLLLARVYILTRVYVSMYCMLGTWITKLSLSLSVGSFGKSQRTVKESVWSDKKVLMLNCHWKRWSDRKVVLTKWIKNLLCMGANLSGRNQPINVSDRLFIYMYMYNICIPQNAKFRGKEIR